MSHDEPSLNLLWETFTGYQRTAALNAAIELDLFTTIAAGATTVEALAARSHAATRGLRALLNHLVMDGFLTKNGENYGLAATAAAFLDRNSVTYLGSVAGFIASPMIMEGFNRLTDAVRRGGTAVPDEGTLAPDHQVWVEFARAMAPVAAMTATLLSNVLDIGSVSRAKVLDIAAGHGMFGVAGRFHQIVGSAFDVPFGDGYEVVLVPNFLHHFDPPTCEGLLRKVRAALAPGGRVVIVEFVPDEDRMGPPEAVRFSLTMLAGTPAGDVYTFAEYQTMLRNAGFASATLHELQPSPARVVIAGR